jgi:hypothetical protein
MAEQPDRPIVNDIEEIASRLRETEHLEPDARAQAADLLDKLAEEIDQAEPSAHKEHLAQTTADLMRAVKDQHDPGVIVAARERLEEAVAKAEAHAPLATDVVLELIDLLARLGI